VVSSKTKVEIEAHAEQIALKNVEKAGGSLTLIITDLTERMSLIENFQQHLKIEDLKNRILYVGILMVYRVGSYITLQVLKCF